MPRRLTRSAPARLGHTSAVRLEELSREHASRLDGGVTLEALRLGLAVRVHEDLSRPRERLAAKTVREEALGLREHHVEALGRVRRPYGHDTAMVAGDGRRCAAQRGVPHSPQNFEVALTSAPQCAQKAFFAAPTGLPHSSQNFAFCLRFARQCGQVAVCAFDRSAPPV